MERRKRKGSGCKRSILVLRCPAKGGRALVRSSREGVPGQRACGSRAEKGSNKATRGIHGRAGQRSGRSTMEWSELELQGIG